MQNIFSRFFHVAKLVKIHIKALTQKFWEDDVLKEKKASGSWLSQCTKCISNGGVGWVLKLPGKVQGENPWLGPGTKPQLS